MNNTSLAIIQREELDTIQDAAKLLALSNYFDGKGSTPQAIAMIATKILAGREMGFGPFASANGIHIIQGRPSVGANLLASAVKSSGRYDYRVKELTDKVCRIEYFERRGDKWESIGISEFTYADGIKAQTKNLDKFPKNMLFARAMSNGVRFYTPDVFGGNAVYCPEELGAEVDGEGNVIDVTPRRVEPTTGEIINQFEDVDFTKPDPPTDAEHDIISQWQSYQDARSWAIMVGACDNEFEAKHSMRKVVEQNNIEVSDENKSAIFLAFLRRQNEKLHEAQPHANGKVAA